MLADVYPQEVHLPEGERDKKGPQVPDAVILRGCQHEECTPNHKCYNLPCYSYVHTLCALENQLLSEENENNRYCCKECKEATEGATPNT